MRQKLITLCPNTWDLAAKKTNFSAWVRDQLRSERNKRDAYEARKVKECVLQCGRPRFTSNLYCAYHIARGQSKEEVE